MRTIKRVVALAGAAASLVFATAALAADVLEGKTAEGVTVKLEVGEREKATAFQIGRAEAQCRHGTLTTSEMTLYRFDHSEPGAFRDKSRDRTRADGVKFKSKTEVEGAERDGSWAGTYERATRVFKRGERIDVCRIKTTWRIG